MKLKSIVLSVMVLGLVAGCALFSPIPTNLQQAQVQQQAVAQQSQQIATTIDAANQLLTELRAIKNTPSPATIPISLPTAPSTVSPSVPTVVATVTTAPTTIDKAAEVLAQLNAQLQTLNTNIQNAPNQQAQQQAAINAAVQASQAAAVTFGGPYGTLIAAGIGIVSVLVQGLFNNSKAHQTAQQAQATASAAVGAMAGAGRFASARIENTIDGPGNAAPAPR